MDVLSEAALERAKRDPDRLQRGHGPPKVEAERVVVALAKQ